jgi:hypothetical protein
MATTPHILTPADLKALRSCTSIHLKSYLDAKGQPVEGVEFKLFSVDRKDHLPVLTFVTYASMRYYSEDCMSQSVSFANGTCHHVLYPYPTLNTPLATTFKVLKAGDEVTICWNIGSHASPAMAAKGFTGDAIELTVRRDTGAKKNQILRFLLEVQVTDSPICRMIAKR